MYKLLLAEDETATREGILENIRWDELLIDRVETAKNGLIALETAHSFCPDILLTDIKMPRMNGIELADAVRKINPDCSVIIISGYPEVEYLKSAIRLKAVNFVDKPIELPALEQQIREAVAIQNSLRENQRLLKTKLASMIQYACFTDSFEETLSTVFPNLKGQKIFCRSYLVRILTKDLGNIPESDLPVYQQKAAKCFENETYVVGIHENLLQITLFGADRPALQAAAYLPILSQCFPENTVYIGMGDTVPFEQYAESFSAAAKLIAGIFYDQKQQLWSAKDIPAEIGSDSFQPDLSQYGRLLAEGDREGLKAFVNSCTAQLRKLRPSPTYAANVYYQMLSALSGLKAEENPPGQTDSAEELLLECIFLEKIEAELLNEIDRYFNARYLYNSNTTINQVLAYIHQNYNHTDLSLNSLSKQYYLSEAYLCVKFKELTGKTFIRYLTEYRIEKALLLLANKDYKINDIATQVGFDTGNYFTRIFKREKGTTPKEFRKRFGIN